MKRILITSTDSMMMQFLVPHVMHLLREGFEVDVACSNVRGRMEEVLQSFSDIPQIQVYPVTLSRSPFKLLNLKGYKELKTIIQNGNYDLIWTNEPVMGVFTRLAAKRRRKSGLYIMYMAHGFHFYKGAPLKNWLLYFPVEWILSSLTDLMVLINQEDYNRALKWFKAKDYMYLNGIGIDTEKFKLIKSERELVRENLHLPINTFLFISVGELEARKNHETTIRAFAESGCQSAHLIIAGTGSLEQKLQKLCAELGVEDRVHLVGYRKDIGSLCKASDVFVFMSLQEGLSVAVMEAMVCGLPVIGSRIRGNTDELNHEKGGYLVEKDDIKTLSGMMHKLYLDPELRNRFGEYNKSKALDFDIETIKKKLSNKIKDELNAEL